jgi:hypothetical protein
MIFNDANANGDLGDPGNWDTAALPTGSDDVQISANVITDSSSGTTCNSLLIDAGISITGGVNLTVGTGNATFGSGVVFAGSFSTSNAGSISLGGGCTLTSSSFSFNSSGTTVSGSISGGSWIYFDLVVSGSVTGGTFSGSPLTVSGNISGVDLATTGTPLTITGGTITSGNYANVLLMGASISGGTIHGNLDMGSTGTITAGTFAGSVTGSTGCVINGGTFGNPVDNSGDLTINGGTFNDNVVLSSGGILLINGGTFNSAVGVNSIGGDITDGIFASSVQGFVFISAGTFSGNVTMGPTASISGGTFLSTSNVGSGNALTIGGGSFAGGVALTSFDTINGGTFTSTSSVSVSSGFVASGTFHGTLNVNSSDLAISTIAGNLILSGPLLGVTTSYTVGGNLTLASADLSNSNGDPSLASPVSSLTVGGNLVSTGTSLSSVGLAVTGTTDITSHNPVGFSTFQGVAIFKGSNTIVHNCTFHSAVTFQDSAVPSGNTYTTGSLTLKDTVLNDGIVAPATINFQGTVTIAYGNSIFDNTTLAVAAGATVILGSVTSFTPGIGANTVTGTTHFTLGTGAKAYNFNTTIPGSTPLAAQYAAAS